MPNTDTSTPDKEPLMTRLGTNLRDWWSPSRTIDGLPTAEQLRSPEERAATARAAAIAELQRQEQQPTVGNTIYIDLHADNIVEIDGHIRIDQLVDAILQSGETL
jgi:Ser/Thr protein kinase RdoA (MazF antagonist)